MAEKIIKKNDKNLKEGKKLKILLDKLHGEKHFMYDELIEFLSYRCEVSILKKKPLDLNQLMESDIFMLICPKKPWEFTEINEVKEYVKSHGGNLVVITGKEERTEYLNKLLKPFEFKITNSSVEDSFLEKDDLKDSPLLKGVESISLSSLTNKAADLSVSHEAEILLKYKDFVLGAKRTFGKGAIYLFSCANAFEKKALKEIDNRTFLNNILKSLISPEMRDTLEIIEWDEDLKQPGLAESAKIRILFGSTPEPKRAKLTTNRSQISLDEMVKHRKSCSSKKGFKLKSEFPFLLKQIGFALLIEAAIVVLFLLNILLIHSFLVLLGAILGFIGGIIYILVNIVDFLIGPKLSTPTKAIESFVRSIEDNNWPRVWNCLTPRARESFHNFKDYKNHLNHTTHMIKEETRKSLGAKLTVHENVFKDFVKDFEVTELSHTLDYEDIHLSALSDYSYSADFNLIVELKRNIKKEGLKDKEFIDGHIVLPQSKGVVLCDKNWLLTSGKIDYPWQY